MVSKRTIAVVSLFLVAAGCADSDSADETLDDPATEAAATEAIDPVDTEVAPSGDETAPGDTESSDTTPSDEGNVAVTTPAPSGPPPSSPTALYEADDIDKGLQPFIDQALDDLADRVGVDAAAITTHAAVLVRWPDASLGCPQPGMSYAQAQMDGSVIELEYDGSYFRYHTGGSQGPFLCDTPITKSPPIERLSVSDGADS